MRRNVDPEQRRPRHVHVSALDQAPEVPEEQRQQQNLDVGAVHIGVGQDADLAVAQTAQIDRLLGGVRIDADRDCDVVHLRIGEQPVALDFPGVQHLAAQRKDCLKFLVPPHLGRPARRIPFDQEQLVARQIGGFAVGQLARQHGHSGALALLHLLSFARPRLRLSNRQLDDAAPVLRIVVQPEFKRRTNERRDQADRVATVQPFLDLPLELGIQNLGRQQKTRTSEHIVRQQLDSFWHQPMRLGEGAHRVEDALAQPGLVRAAGRGRNQIHEGLPRGRALLGPGQHPARAFPGRPGRVVLGGVTLRFEDGCYCIRAQRLLQILAQTALVAPFESPSVAFEGQADPGARKQHRLAAQQPFELVRRNLDRVEILPIRPYGHARAARRVAGSRGAGGERRSNVPIGEPDRVDSSIAPHRHVEPARQCIGD